MFNTIILAVDDHNEMMTDKSFFLHEVSFQPMIKWVIDNTNDAKSQIIVSKKDDSELYSYIDNSLDVVCSVPKLIEKVDGIGNDILIIKGNFPLVTKETLNSAFEFHINNPYSCTFITVGKNIDKCIFFVKPNVFAEFINYFTGDTFDVLNIIDYLNNKELSYGYYPVADENDLLEVNNRIELSNAQSIMNGRIVKKHLLNGVTFISPDTAYIGNDVVIKNDTVIMPNTIIKGNTQIGSGCIIGPNTQITDSEISDCVEINSSVILNSVVGEKTKVGPFAYIRPGSKIGSNIKIGDFVEIKNSVIGNNTKVSHLTYVGDADVGENVNFGCGTVLVNYDGTNKYRSTIENNAFIGCNTNLVSPVNIKENAFIAAGSTITDDVPENALAIARARQVNKTEWKRKGRKS